MYTLWLVLAVIITAKSSLKKQIIILENILMLKDIENHET